MPVSYKTKIMVWGRAASRCSLPDCRLELVMDATLTDDPSLVGEVAHIVAQSPDGPRGDHPMSLEQRDKYNNLLLLCPVHHKLIDDHPDEYPVESLQQTKQRHESWVRENLDFDLEKQQDDELYATFLSEWVEKCNVDEWEAWTSFFFTTYPRVQKEHFEQLREFSIWMMRRIWPKRYPNLEHAFRNFQRVLWDTIQIFRLHTTEKDFEDCISVPQFYKDQWYSQEVYDKRGHQWQNHLDLLENMFFELTRAANYLIDQVQRTLHRGYRMEEGYLYVIAQRGFAFEFIVPQYTKEDILYIDLDEGLKSFIQIVESRTPNVPLETNVTELPFWSDVPDDETGEAYSP